MAAATAAVTASVAGKLEKDEEVKKEVEVDTETKKKKGIGDILAIANSSSVTPKGSGGGGGGGAHSHSAVAYAPFKMAAAGSSPIIKNFGDKKARGYQDDTPAAMKSFDASGGAINEEMVDGISTTPGKFAASVGSSPAKGFWGSIKKGLGGVFGGAKKALGLGGGGGDASVGGDAPEVPPHGDDAHTGGAIGGAPEGEAPWEAMDRKGFMGMDKGARKDYMGGLDKGQRKQQMQAMNPWSGIMGSGGGGGGGWGGIGGAIGGMFSDERLKENIKRTGTSPSGIPTYEFNYIGCNDVYGGVIAQDLLHTPHVVMHESGFYMVNYDNIDVEMELL